MRVPHSRPLCAPKSLCHSVSMPMPQPAGVPIHEHLTSHAAAHVSAGRARLGRAFVAQPNPCLSGWLPCLPFDAALQGTAQVRKAHAQAHGAQSQALPRHQSRACCALRSRAQTKDQARPFAQLSHSRLLCGHLCLHSGAHIHLHGPCRTADWRRLRAPEGTVGAQLPASPGMGSLSGQSYRALRVHAPACAPDRRTSDLSGHPGSLSHQLFTTASMSLAAP